jgi:oligopeptide/dipeptide ABC transporter ATP-binding protein
MELQRKENMSLLLVSHDMAVIAETCDRVAVMYAGILVETGTTEAIFANPRHPYTLGLMRSIPRISEDVDRLDSIPGHPPDLLQVGDDCPFEPRCEYAVRECRHERIALRKIEPGHYSACLFPERVA